MSLVAHATPSGYLLPSIHSAPPFFTKQINPTTRSIADDHWTRIILGYARHRRLFTLRVEDAETSGNEWDEIFRNERINRRLLPDHLASLISSMVANNLAVYEPPKQSRSVLLYWRRPEEWADVLHSWVASTGQMNTIMTFYEITDPPVESPLSSLPIVILRKAIDVLSKSARAQIIAIADGEGVRFFPGGNKI
ncbi:VPS25 family protein [Pleurotus pulmonarius]